MDISNLTKTAVSGVVHALGANVVPILLDLELPVLEEKGEEVLERVFTVPEATVRALAAKSGADPDAAVEKFHDAAKTFAGAVMSLAPPHPSS